MDKPAGLLGAALERNDVVDILVGQDDAIAVRFSDGIILRGKVRSAFERARTWVGEHTPSVAPRRCVDFGGVRWRVFLDERLIALRAKSLWSL